MEKSWSRSPRSVQGSRSRQLMLCDECKNALDNDYAYSYYDCSCFYEDNTCTNHTVITCVAEHWLWRRINICVQRVNEIYHVGHRWEFLISNPANRKRLHNICTTLDHRRRRWVDVVQMLYDFFVFAGKCVKMGWAVSQSWASISTLNQLWGNAFLASSVEPFLP